MKGVFFIITILMLLFAILLFSAAGFLLSSKASMLIINEAPAKHEANLKFFKIYGSLLLICGLFNVVLLFFQPHWLVLTFLVVTCFLILFFILGLNKRIN